MSAIRVLIADDSETMRAALAAVLGADPAFQVVGSAADGRAVVEQALALRPDVITMDVLMPGLDGLDATAAIDLDGSRKRMMSELRQAGVNLAETP